MAGQGHSGTRLTESAGQVSGLLLIFITTNRQVGGKFHHFFWPQTLILPVVFQVAERTKLKNLNIDHRKNRFMQI